MNLRVLTVFLFALLLSPVTIAVGEVIYVDGDSPGGDGSNWAAAFKYLQDGLAIADANDEIRVAQGTYVPDRSSANPGGSGERVATFDLVNGVSIRGGYAGLSEPHPNERDIEAYETVLSGDLAGDDGADFLNNDENSYHIVTGSGTDANAAFDGFSVIAGNANGPKPNDRGAGMYNYEGSPTVMNCTFGVNYAKLSGAGIFNGGDDYDEDEEPPAGYVSSRTVVIGCVFSDNLAGYENYHSRGAGICNNCYSIATVTDCVFIGNTAGNGYDRGRGAGMYNDAYSKSFVNKCVFSDNSAGQTGGGMANSEYCTAEVVDCVFIGNTALWSAGGMYNAEHSSPTIINCAFSANSAGGMGGAVRNRVSSPTFIGCIFSGNSTAGWAGGAMTSHHGFLTLTGCTFFGNSTAAEGMGGGIHNDWIDGAALTNCVFWDNTADEGPQIALTHWEASITSVDYCNVQGGEADIYVVDAILDWGEGNIGEDLIGDDPRFVRPGYGGRGTWIEGDHHLRWDSPCINAGDPGGDHAGQLDLDGEPRVMGGRIDMGADEVGEKQADLTRNGIINFEDFSAFSQSWPENNSSQNWNVLCDLYEDEQIDTLDVAEFVSDWLWEAEWYEP